MLGAAAVTGFSAAAAEPATTAIRTVSPVTAAGQLAAGFTITHRYTDANCQSGSPTTGRSYACFAPTSPEGVFDSCWVESDTSFAICLVKPWQHKVARLHVTRGYDDSHGFLTVHQPWGVRLGQHTRCLVILAPVNSAQGRPINYACNKKIVLAGSIDRGSATWRIRAYRRVHRKRHPVHYRPMGRQPIAIAWSGKPSQHD
jgi:hypothetical protein